MEVKLITEKLSDYNLLSRNTKTLSYLQKKCNSHSQCDRKQGDN